MRCPNCSEVDAPLGTLVSELRTVMNGVGAGRATDTSDAKKWAVGDSVEVTVIPGSPGQLLDITIAGQHLLPVCSATSNGQCGA